MITLTKRHTGQTLPTMLDEVAEAFRALRKLPVWTESVRGGVYVYEVTRGENGTAWHAHVHVLVDGGFIKQAELSAAWLKVTGDSPIVHVKYIHQRESGAKYVARYVGKPTGMENWNGEEIVEFSVAVHGRRLIHTFGKVHRAGHAIEEREPGTNAVEHVTSVAEFRRAAERGDEQAAWSLERLIAGFMVPRAKRETLSPEDLTEIVLVGRRLDAERHRRMVDGDSPPAVRSRPSIPTRVVDRMLWSDDGPPL